MITKAVPARLSFADIRPDQPARPDTQASRGRGAILPEPWEQGAQYIAGTEVQVAGPSVLAAHPGLPVQDVRRGQVGVA